MLQYSNALMFTTQRNNFQRTERTYVFSGPCCKKKYCGRQKDILWEAKRNTVGGKKKYCGRQCGNVEKLFRQLLCVSFLSLVAVSLRKNLFWEDLVAKPKWSGFWIYFKEGHPGNLICHRSSEEEEEHCSLCNLGRSRILLHHHIKCPKERLSASLGRETMCWQCVDWKLHFSLDKYT